MKSLLVSDRLLWTKDGKNGPDDPNTSMSILLKWLTTEGNYSKYRGGSTSHGKGKIYWCSILSKEIKQAGIRKYRSPKAIKNKITNIEDSFKAAHDWAYQTGAGLKDDNPGQFHDYIKKKCPYYFDLLTVMQDRATARPQTTSDTIEIDDDDDDEDDFVVAESKTSDFKDVDLDSLSSTSRETKRMRSTASVPSFVKRQRTPQSKKVDPFLSVLELQNYGGDNATQQGNGEIEVTGVGLN